MENLHFMVECLKEYNYSRIHQMADKEIIEIFGTVNRSFLVSWILKQMDDRFVEICENANKEKLADIIYCYGFCNANEKNQFMNGECDSTKQFLILTNMFNALKTFSGTKTVDVDDSTFSSNHIQNLLNFNVNLFPTYGPTETLNPTKRANKVQEYHQEISNLKALLNSSNQNQNISVDPLLKNQLEEAVKQLEHTCLDFRRKTLSLVQHRPDREAEKVNFPEDFLEVLEACYQKFERVFEFMKSLNTVLAFKGENLRVENVECENKNTEMLRELAELCNEINAMKGED
ncbi:uncharacterized protein LOC123009914 [Tribolium madens]|uniref:uncharacterized protein LOC123009914 n=1 Tax=Tribolium madens TaxID=41895 RepID=UPI001CF7232B|nr:uncharacterized protein LOC123009914 [Tribolium madens]